MRVERDSEMCVARDLYELWSRSPYTRMLVALRRGRKLEVAQGTVYISRPKRSWIRPWRWFRRRQQRSFLGGIYVHPEERYCYVLKGVGGSGRRFEAKKNF